MAHRHATNKKEAPTPLRVKASFFVKGAKSEVQFLRQRSGLCSCLELI